MFRNIITLQFITNYALSDNKEISERIKQLRLKMGYSQENMASLLDIKRGAYQAYEGGRNAWPQHIIAKIVTKCNTTFEYVLQGVEPAEQAGYTNGVNEPKSEYLIDPFALLDKLAVTNDPRLKMDIANQLKAEFHNLQAELNTTNKKYIELIEKTNKVREFLESEHNIKL